MESPFKFLEAYQKNDRNLFFGREAEIAELYGLVARSNLVVVYGKSGVGKTSLIKCGLINEYDPSEMVLIEVRRKHNLLDALREQLLSFLNVGPETTADLTIPELVEKIYHRTLKSVFLFFDQFEELFILGDGTEKNKFQETIKAIRNLNMPCVILLVIREEYLSELTDFRKEVKFIFTHMMQVQQMNQDATVEVVDKIFEKLTDKGRSEAISYDTAMTADLVSIVANGKFFIELPYLQVYLDKLFRIADEKKESEQVLITPELLQEPRISRMEKVISNLLTDQIKTAMERIGDISEADIISLLKIFVTAEDTKQPVYLAAIIEAGSRKNVRTDQIDTLLEIFTNALLLRPLEGNQYELTHDSLAREIGAMRAKTKRTVPVIEGNPYKGLAAFTGREEDIKRFFGRENSTKKVLSLLSEHQLVVISGASGTGKSSLVKAGILPQLKSHGLTAVVTIRPGHAPQNAIKAGIDKLGAFNSETQGYLLIIDQYEELITRPLDDYQSHAFEETLLRLLENPASLIDGFTAEKNIRIIITIRADMEPQFKIGALKEHWDAGRYVLPYMTVRELEYAIEAPAELAAVYFEPPSLIRNIAEEVYGRASALPLLSFALSLMFEASLPDRLITLPIYSRIGIFGALYTKAEEIFSQLDGLREDAMRHIMLRMISFSGSEIASRRVSIRELDFVHREQYEEVRQVLNRLEKERLIVEQTDENGEPYFEPAHDALLLGWPRLWEWVNYYSKERMLSRERLWFAIGEWNRSRKDQTLLWSDDKRFYDFEDLGFREGEWINREEEEFYERSSRIRRKRKLKNRFKYSSLAAACVIVMLSAAFFYYNYDRSEKLKNNLQYQTRLSQTLEKQKNIEKRLKDSSDLNLLRSKLSAGKISSALAELQIEHKRTEELSKKALKNEKLAEDRAKSLAIAYNNLDQTNKSLQNSEQLSRQQAASINLLYTQLNREKARTDTLNTTLQTLLNAKNDTIKIYDVLAGFQESEYLTSQAKAYQTTLAKQTGYRAVWPVDKKLKIGDVGKFSNGTFVVEKKLLDLNIPVTEKQELFSNPGLDGLHGNVKVDNQGDTTIFDFPKNSFLVKSYAPVRHYISNLSAVAANVQKLYNKGRGNWQSNWLIITELIQTDQGLIIMAEQKSKFYISNQHKPLQIPEDIPTDPIILKQPNGPKVVRGQLNPYFKVMGLRTDLW